MEKTNTFVKPVALGSIAAVAFLALVQGTIASAQTFLYVTADGDLATVEADTADMAIMTAPNIMYNSGVIEVDNYNELAEDDVDTSSDTTATAGGDDTYAYVDKSGDVEYVEADSDSEALNEAEEEDAAYNSGVLDTEEFDESEDLE